MPEALAASQLKSIIMERLAPVRSSAPYALVDYPNYLNPGDAAIWLGSRNILQELNGAPPAYTSTLMNFSPNACRSAIGDGIIYFLGGGNFGDIHSRHHRARLRVLAAVPENPAVQLPASCAWSGDIDTDLLEETRRVLRRRQRVVFLARERKSQAELHSLLGIESMLCPDLAHALHVARTEPTIDLRVLLRQDNEALRTGAGQLHPEAADWRDLKTQIVTNRLGKLALALSPPCVRSSVQDRVASAKVASALSLLRPARTVITDRLHGFIFSAKLQRIVVVMDNRTGKSFSYLETWRRYFADVHRAESIGEACEAARTLSGGSR